MKVKILNEEIDIQFCMAVELAYERISGKPFDTTALATAEGRLALGMAAIISAKPDTLITIERLLREAKGSDIKAMNDAQTAFSEVLNQVNQVLRFVITGQVDEGGCGGNCSGCTGCQ